MGYEFKKSWVLIFGIPIILSCASIGNTWKDLDLRIFKISIPNDWNYKKLSGIDSFVGEFSTHSGKLEFDCSGAGYANNLIPTAEEYIRQGRWKRESYFYKVGVTYTANFNVANEKAAQMKAFGTTDSALVSVEADPSYEMKTNVHRPTANQRIMFPKADFIADLTYKDSTIHVPIEIPSSIKNHNIQIDTTEKYVIKTIYPKKSSKGMTGIYVQSRSSAFNFNMSGYNLSAQDQQSALQAFKTITFKQ